jgi:hypothetical protein
MSKCNRLNTSYSYVEEKIESTQGASGYQVVAWNGRSRCVPLLYSPNVVQRDDRKAGRCPPALRLFNGCGYCDGKLCRGRTK